ncbi:MAG: thioesterase family protein, partial [Flavobacteriales bacterium]|nr:thioesterase family protein [Flavobacteriales bacterium]
VDVEIEVPINGRSIAQAVATVRDGERILHRTAAGLGQRESQLVQQFAVMPDVPAPDACVQKREDAFGQDGNLLAQFDRRTARQSDDEGYEYMWIRPKAAFPLNAGLLALMADFFLGAHTATRGGTSLDNTFRLFATRPAGWVLNVSRFDGIDRGAVHGTVQQFAEDGALLATGSQTGLLPR